jgi:nuclear transcription Y subunit beta
MKNTLPENAKIAKDSKECVQECVSEFISFITSEASDKVRLLVYRITPILVSEGLWYVVLLCYPETLVAFSCAPVFTFLFFFHHQCLQEKRKTINGDDLLWAMSTLGFDKYVEPLKLYLSKYREAVRSDKPDKRSTGAQEDY